MILVDTFHMLLAISVYCTKLSHNDWHSTRNEVTKDQNEKHNTTVIDQVTGLNRFTVA